MSLKLINKLNKLLKKYRSRRIYLGDLVRWRFFKLVDYKAVEICVDAQNNLIIIPGGARVESVKELLSPFNDSLLAESLLEAIKQSRYQDKDDSFQENVLEKYLGVGDYQEAIKGRRLVFFFWSRRKGYNLTPTLGLSGSNFYELPQIPIGKKIDKEILVEATKKAISLSKPPDSI